MTETIYFNGKKYNQISDMPKEVRQMYEQINRILSDENKDGIPDSLQTGGLSGIKNTISMIKDLSKISQTGDLQPGKFSIIRVTDSGIFMNGKEYANMAEMPRNIQQEFQNIIRSSPDGKEDIFEESWREIERDRYFSPHDDEILNQQFTSRIPIEQDPIQNVDSTGRFVSVVILAILILGGLLTIWLLFF
jgi:hypothetical protein